MQTDTHLQPLTVPTFQPSNVPTWKDELSEHLADLRLMKRSVALARQHINVFTAWYQAQFGEPFNPQTLTHYALAQYRHHTLNEARLAAATWNSRHWALTILCNWIGVPQLMHGIEQKEAIQQSELHRSLIDAEYHRLHETLERRILSAITVFEHRDRVRDRAAVTLMLEAMLRVDEVHALDKSDITLHERSGVVLVRNGKGGKERKVPLNQIARDALKDYLELRHDDNPALFDGKQTDRLSTRSIQRIITDLRPGARIPDLLCHSLRYTGAKRCETRMNKQGLGPSEIIRTLMRLLGHKRPDTTEIYLRSSFDVLMSAVGEVE
jgi:Site-specific recombinase XerC